ncbi:MAG: hypothetical protein ABI560_07135, partial [Myxococcales bacterium]
MIDHPPPPPRASGAAARGDNGPAVTARRADLLRVEDVISPRGGLVRGTRRPAGWIAPGPAPRPPEDVEALWPDGEEDLCWLAGDWRLLQRRGGHRFSLDDLV